MHYETIKRKADGSQTMTEFGDERGCFEVMTFVAGQPFDDIANRGWIDQQRVFGLLWLAGSVGCSAHCDLSVRLQIELMDLSLNENFCQAAQFQ